MADSDSGALVSGSGHSNDSSNQENLSSAVLPQQTLSEATTSTHVFSDASSSIANSNLSELSSGEDNSVSQLRSHRKTTLTLKGRESKISDLNVTLTRKLNAHIRHMNVAQVDVAKGITLDNLVALCDEVASNAEQVSELYTELDALSENKVHDKIKTMYEFYSSAVTKFREVVNTQVDELENEKLQQVEDSIRQANASLEEEEKLFEELMVQMEQNPLQRLQILQARTPAVSEQGRTATTNSTELDGISRPLQIDISSRKERTSISSNTGGVAEAESRCFTPSNRTSELDVMKQLADTIAAAIGGRKSVEPAVFVGNVLEFADWEVDMDTYLRVERIEGHERLRHIKKYLGGDAKKCVEGHFVTNTNDAYLAARKTLKERYGNEQNIARSFRRKLENWPKVASKDGKALREFSDFLCHLRSAMSSNKALKILNDCTENEKMVEKVPEWLKIKWAHIVAKTEKNEDRYPSFYEFSKLVEEEADVMSLPVIQSTVNKDRDRKPLAKTTRTYLSAITEKDAGCLFCGLSNHVTAMCRRLQGKTREEKSHFMREKGMCFRCLITGHRSKGCATKLDCSICHKQHATANHDPAWKDNKERRSNYNNPTGAKEASNLPAKEKKPDPNSGAEHQCQTSKDNSSSVTNTQRKVQVNAIEVKQNLTSMAVPVYVSAGTGRELLVYALLDNQSDACFISDEVVQKLKPEVTEVESVKICTMNGEKEEDVNRYDHIKLKGYNTDSYAIVSVYQQSKITVNRSQLPSPTKAEKIDHLKQIAREMPPLLDIPVGLLLGMDYPELIQPLEIRPAPNNSPGKPFGIRTLFGWTMCGGSSDRSDRRTVYKVDLKRETELLDILERDFRDIDKSSEHISQDDIKFLQT